MSNPVYVPYFRDLHNDNQNKLKINLSEIYVGSLEFPELLTENLPIYIYL